MKPVLFWHWWVLAAIFVTLEIVVPGTFMLWLGVAAGAIGLVLFVAPDLRVEIQLLIFAAISVGSILAWRAWLKRHPTPTDHPTLNRRAEQYVSRVFRLEQPIVNGQGKAIVDDTTWLVTGPDLPAGAAVRCVGVDGTVLRVEKAEAA